MHWVLFPFGLRLTTLLTLGVFLALGVRDRRFWLAGAAWIGGWEVLFQAAETVRSISRGGFHPTAWWVPVVVFGTYAVGCAFVIVAARKGARPSLIWLAAALAVFAAWVATGFHVNGHDMVGFNSLAEALNEGAKTLWALAYLVPLLADRAEVKRAGCCG